MFRKACLLLWLLLSLQAMARQLPFETYTPRNGLVDGRVNTIYQDKRGRICIATNEGFSIYDGQRFRNYTSVDGINVGIVIGIIEPDSNTLMLFDFNGKIFLVRGEAVSVDTTHARQLTEFSKILDCGKNEWLIITNTHLYRFINGNYTLLNVDFGDGFPSYIDNAVVYGPYLLLYRWNVPSSNRLIIYNYQTQQVTGTLQGYKAGGLVSDRKNNIYFTNGKEWMQLNKTALARGQLLAEPLWFKHLLPVGFGQYNLNFDDENNAWLLDLNKSACKIDAITGQKQFFLTRDGLLPGVYSLFTDREKNYWFASMSNGVQKMQQSALESIQKLNNKELQTVWMINPLSDGSCFINAKGGSFIRDNNNSRQLSDGGGFAYYWHDQLWRLTDEKSLQGNKGTVLPLTGNSKVNTKKDFALSGNTITDREGRWLLTGNCLFVIDNDFSIQARPLPYYSDNVVIDAENNYWCFLRDGKAICYRWMNDTLQEAARYNISPYSSRFSIHWNADTFLIGTRSHGIVFYKLSKDKSGVAGRITKATGLSNNFINSLQKINSREFAAGTATGLDIIKISGRDTIIDRVSSRSNNFVGIGKLAMDKDSIIYVIVEGGQLFQLKRPEPVNSGFQPQAWFSNISVNGTLVDARNEKMFGYTRNNFLFNISAPSFLDNRNTGFVFRLKGNGQEWTQNNNQPDFAINNLLPGKYTLIATVIYSRNTYPNKTITYCFTILPPFWKTGWFITLSVILVLSIPVLMIWIYFRRKLARQRIVFEKGQAVEKERTRIATDMHDDFGASLSRIKFLSEKLKLKKSTQTNIEGDLEKISNYSDEMSERLNEIVWALNQKYDSPGDLYSFCRAYASDFLFNQGIQFEFREPAIPDMPVPGEIRRNVFLSLKECLHNIARHSGANLVIIQFSFSHEQLEIIIHDNGKGIDFSNIRPFANGIENIRLRMQQIGGFADFTNENGTKITLSVMLPL